MLDETSESGDQNTNDNIHYLEPLLSWRVHEYPHYERSKQWYIVFGLVSLALILLCVIPNPVFGSPNYTFAILIVLIDVVLIASNHNKAEELDVILTDEGVFIGREFFDYDKFKEFSVIFKPAEKLKVLYLEYKNSIKPRLSIKLNEANPLEVREILLQFLEEDLNRTDESNTDYFSRLLKF